MNNGQVMLMDDFLSEEEQLLLAQGFEMDEDDENRYYFDQDGNLSNIFKKAFSAIDKGLAKFDKAVISPILTPVISTVGKTIGTVGNLATNPGVLSMAAKAFATKTPPDPQMIANVLSGALQQPTQDGGSIGPAPGTSLQSMIGNTAGMPDWLMQKTAVNVPASSPELIPQAKQIAQSMDYLKSIMRTDVGMPSPPSMPMSRPSMPQTTGFDINSIIKNPIVLGVGGLVLLKVLKVF
jgi:hypothetical protein